MPDTEQVEVIEDFVVTAAKLDRQKAKILALVGGDPAVVAAIDELEQLAIDYGHALAY